MAYCCGGRTGGRNRGWKQLAAEAAHWQRLSGVMGRVLAMQPEGGKQ
jgi:hypothetical protein